MYVFLSLVFFLVILFSVSLSFLSILFVQYYYLFTSILPSFTYAFYILLYSPYQTCTKYQFLCTSGIYTGSNPCRERYSHPYTDGLAYTPCFILLAINNLPLNNQPPVPVIGFPPTPTHAWCHLHTVPFENIAPCSGECLMFYTGKRRF
jgi:hypothetical protein